MTDDQKEVAIRNYCSAIYGDWRTATKDQRDEAWSSMKWLYEA